MATTRIYGRPARHARRLARRATGQIAVAGALIAAGGYGVMAASGTASTAAGAAMLIAAALAQPAVIRRRRALAGVRAEQRVARMLRDAGAHAVVHGADLAPAGVRAGDVDHVVVGPWVAAVETKSGRGRVRTSGRSVSVDGRTLPRDPLGQARRGANLLRRRLGVDAAAVLCIVDMAGPPQQHDGVTICAAKDLPAVLATLPRRLGAPQAEQLAQDIPLAE